MELSGRVSPDAPRLNTERLTEMFGKRFFFLEILDKTRPDIRPEQYADSLTLKGEFVRRVMAMEELDEDERNAILQVGLAALRGEGDEI